MAKRVPVRILGNNVASPTTGQAGGEGDGERAQQSEHAGRLRHSNGNVVVTTQNWRGNRKKENGEYALTLQQETFAQGVAKGLTLAESYRQAYGTHERMARGMSKGWVHRAASKLMQHGGVKQRVTEIVEQKQRDSLHDANRIRLFVVERLHHEARHAREGGARVRSLELLGKIDYVGLFKASETEEKAKSATELEQELRDKLSAMLGNLPMVGSDKS